MIVSARRFLNPEIKDNLRAIVRKPTPESAYTLGLAQKYSWANFRAQKYLEAIRSIKHDSTLLCGDLLVIGDYRLRCPHFFNSFWDTPVSSINFKDIENFALKEIPALMQDLGGLDR